MKDPEHIVMIGKCVERLTGKITHKTFTTAASGGDTGRKLGSAWTTKFHRKTTGLVLFLASH